MKRKSQNCVDVKVSVQSPLQKFVIGNSGQNILKNGYQNFLVLSNFAILFNFLQNILSLIVVKGS